LSGAGGINTTGSSGSERESSLLVVIFSLSGQKTGKRASALCTGTKVIVVSGVFVSMRIRDESMDKSTRHCSRRDLTDAAKNRLAIDGLRFLAVEEKYGLEAAIECDTWSGPGFLRSKRGEVIERYDLP
jgi:hypothetical protein